MNACLRPDEVVDAVDGVLAPARRAHLAGCEACRATVQGLGQALDEVRRDEVPEPSPFFWPAINARVRAAVAAEPPPRHDVWSWRAWLPATALAGLVLAIAAPLATRDTPGNDALAAIEIEPAADAATGVDDPALALVVDLASLEEDDANPLGLQPIGDFGDVAARTLSPDEQDALRALLRTAVERPPS